MEIRLSGQMFALCCFIGMAVSPDCSAEILNQFQTVGDWSEAGNWSLGHIPDSTEVARISVSATLTNTQPAVAELRIYKDLTVSGAETWVTADRVRVGYNSGISITGSLTLSGGRLEMQHVVQGGGTGMFHFDGGTVATLANRTDFMGGLATVDVLSGGAKIEVNHAITISQAITHDVADPTGKTKDGGLFKDGSEKLTMTGALSFNGDIRVEAGTLDLTGATYTPGADAGLGGGGTFIPKGGAFTVNGIVAPGTIHGTGTLTVQGIKGQVI